jgi:MoxR-like ATPase
MTCEDISRVQEAVKQVGMEKSVAQYIVKLIRATRNDVRISLGASPRALLTLSRCCQARAYLEGRDHILPDDIQYLAVPILAHRIMLENKAKYSGISAKAVIAEIVKSVEVPV